MLGKTRTRAPKSDVVRMKQRDTCGLLYPLISSAALKNKYSRSLSRPISIQLRLILMMLEVREIGWLPVLKGMISLWSIVGAGLELLAWMR